MHAQSGRATRRPVGIGREWVNGTYWSLAELARSPADVAVSLRVAMRIQNLVSMARMHSATMVASCTGGATHVSRHFAVQFAQHLCACCVVACRRHAGNPFSNLLL